MTKGTWRSQLVYALSIPLVQALASAQSTAPATHTAVPEALATSVDEYAASGSDRTCTIVVQPAGYQMAPGAGDWSALQWNPVQGKAGWQVQWSALGERRALVATSLDETAGPRARTSVWTGMEWFTRQVTPRGTQWMFAPQAMPDPEWDFVSLFNGGLSWHSFAGPQAIVDLVRSFRFVSETVGDERTTYVYAWSDKPGAPHLVITLGNVDGNSRVHSIETRTHTPPTETAPPVLFGRKVLQLDWGDVHDGGLPRRAIYMQGRTDGASTDIEVHAMLIERSECSALRLDDVANKRFEPPPFEKGDAVVDRCYGLSYAIGDTTLIMNSVQVEAKVPIDHRITTDLKEVVGEIAGVNQGKATTSDKP